MLKLEVKKKEKSFFFFLLFFENAKMTMCMIEKCKISDE